MDALNAWLESHGGATASDACSDVSWSHDYDALSDDCGATGSALVTFTATDSCGNASMTSATFTIEDTSGPVFGFTTVIDTVSCDSYSVDSSYITMPADICGNVSMTWVDTDAMEVECANTYQVTRTYTATDDCGNESEAIQIIHIQDTTDQS